MNGTVRLYGDATFDYTMITDSKLSVDNLDNKNNIPWGMKTLFRVDFSKGLVAGNVVAGSSPPTSYDIYKSKNGEELVLAATVPVDDMEFIDYAVCNNSDYVYYIYPAGEEYIGTPLITNHVRTRWNAWYLFVCDYPDEHNMYKADYIYVFEFDLGDIQYQNNTTVNKITTFSKHLRVHKNSVNSMSGTLEALLGVIDCDISNDYFETADMTDAIRVLSTDTNPKFLRDMEGHFYKVEVSSPITFNQQYYLNSYKTSKNLEWQEVADASKSMVISK